MPHLTRGDHQTTGRQSQNLLNIPDWFAGEDYGLNDAVFYADCIYVCKIPHTSTAIFTDNLDKWVPICQNPDQAPIPNFDVGYSTPASDFEPHWKNGDNITAGDVGYIYMHRPSTDDNYNSNNFRGLIWKVRALDTFTMNSPDSSPGFGPVYDPFQTGAEYDQGKFEIIERYNLISDPNTYSDATTVRYKCSLSTSASTYTDREITTLTTASASATRQVLFEWQTPELTTGGDHREELWHAHNTLKLYVQNCVAGSSKIRFSTSFEAPDLHITMDGTVNVLPSAEPSGSSNTTLTCGSTGTYEFNMSYVYADDTIYIVQVAP